MKPLARFATSMGVLLGAAALSAQNFSGSDDFSSATGYWSDGPTTGGAAFSLFSGVLHYADPGLTAGQSSSATRYWNLNTGSYAYDWQVQMRFQIDWVQVPSQVSALSLILQNGADPGDRAEISIEILRDNPGIHFISSTFFTDGVAGTPVQQGTMVEPLYVQATYLAATHQIVLAASYTGEMTAIASAFIDASGLSWGMGPADGFLLGLRGTNSVTTGSTPPITIDQGIMYVDDFTAIPEPSAYAAGLGLVSLAGSLLRRRFRQK